MWKKWLGFLFCFSGKLFQAFHHVKIHLAMRRCAAALLPIPFNFIDISYQLLRCCVKGISSFWLLLFLLPFSEGAFHSKAQQM